MWTSENNWYKWSYGNGPAFGLQNSNLTFNTSYTCGFNGVIVSFREELLKAASSTLDHYPGLKPCIFFSGGADSELLLRTYLDIGSNPEVYIVRYENDYNIYDVSYAITICNILGIKYHLIDFQLEKFYETDAEKISELAQIDRPRALPYCKFLELVDGLPILGEGDPYWVRLNDDYSQKDQWRYRDIEAFTGWDKYARHLNRPAVPQFFKWTPGLILSHTKLDWFTKLINDEYSGKLGTNSTKLQGYKEIYSDMIHRQKQTGFEKTDAMINSFEQFLSKKYNGLPYRQYQDRTLDELRKEILND